MYVILSCHLISYIDICMLMSLCPWPCQESNQMEIYRSIRVKYMLGKPSFTMTLGVWPKTCNLPARRLKGLCRDGGRCDVLSAQVLQHRALAASLQIYIYVYIYVHMYILADLNPAIDRTPGTALCSSTSCPCGKSTHLHTC